VRITHATSVHPRFDTRIAIKMCRSAREAGHDVTFVVADGMGGETRDGIEIIDAANAEEKNPQGRLNRATQVARRVMQTALDSDADIIHFHDPELLPHAVWLRRRNGPRLIFDAHEDIPKQILGKHYLPRFSRRLAGVSYAALERGLVSRMDAVIAATPTIAERYSAVHPNVRCVANFPRKDELLSTGGGNSDREGVCYVGGISPTRGIRQMVDSLAHTESNTQLFLAGRFSSIGLRKEVSRSMGWPKVVDLGFLNRDGVRELLGSVAAGLVTLHGTPAYKDAYPTKMFEYMSAGVPVISSDFPLWKEFVEPQNCGLCVNPSDPRAIARAIDRLVGNPKEAYLMGRNGRAAVEKEFNWESQSERLLSLYRSLY